MGIKMGTPPKQQASDENLTVQNGSYSGVSFSILSETNNPRGVFFNDGGTKMLIVGREFGRVYRYTLGTGFDLSTASFDNLSFSVSAQDSNPLGIFFNPPGTKMFIVGTDNDRVYQYTLGTGFDLPTASYDSVSFDVSSQDIGPTGLFFNSTGTKMFMVGTSNDSVYQYTLGTGFDLSSASFDNVSFDISSESLGPSGISFNSTGTRMFMLSARGSNNSVYQYTLGTGFDLSTASYDSVSFDVSNEDGNPRGIFFNATGTKMFMVGAGTNSVHQYDL